VSTKKVEIVNNIASIAIAHNMITPSDFMLFFVIEAVPRFQEVFNDIPIVLVLEKWIAA
jgi:hypothetical protein